MNNFLCKSVSYTEVTEMDDHANVDHSYDTVEADDKESDLESKPFYKVHSLSDQ